MSTCVNLSLKEFKDCCKRLNVSAATLEPIIHEYINTVGDENSFPTDAYIERVIHGSEQPVLSEEQVTLWEKRYSQPTQFNNVLEAMSYVTEAERFFPRESIGLKETTDGKVEVRVTKPIYVGPNTSLEEFAREQERQEQEWREVQQRDAIEAEKLLIKQKAIADGTFMLAPNGKPTNLTEDQWLSVRTKAFKEWFGDWENDPKNASKVVDENKEPKVMYHITLTSNIKMFDKNKVKHGGFWFSSDPEYYTRRENNKEKYNTIPAFLNIKNPNEISHGLFLRAIDGDVQSENLDDTNFDGWITRYVHHPEFYDDEYRESSPIFAMAVNSNQVKSAEDNITFSTTDNNIYHNKNLKDRYNTLLKYAEENINQPGFSLKDFNRHWGTNFGFNPKTKEVTTRDERIHGVSIWNPNDTKVEAKKKIDRVQLLNYLSVKFGLKFKEISNEEYEKKAGSLSNCCVIGDTVYIRKGDLNKLDNEQLIEEFLHPLVNAIYKSNPELTKNLLEEAKKLFPDLTKQIAVAYADQSKQVQDEELITQVLSKYLNKEISDKGANTRKLADYIKQFIESILDLVKDLFGDVRIEKGTRLKVSGKDIKTVFGFENLAKLINSKEITFTDTLGAKEWRNNRTFKTFTFNDGITVNTSFTPNEQQVQALNEMSDFIESNETHMTLSGYAGTGKTSLMEMLAEKMNKQHRGIIFSASTNKAAAVLKARVAKSGFPAYTLNKVFGISVEVDPNKEYDAKDLITVLKDSDIIYPGAVVVIDEASMINEHNYNVLNGIAEQYGIKIIYVGDEAQLSPVKENKESKVFRDNNGRIARLTKVERTDDNAILKEATALRNGEELSGESSFNERGEGVAYVSQTNKTTIREIVQRFVKGLKNNPNYFRILAYTNKAVAKYNLAVRNALGYNDGVPRVGEPMTGYSNWGYEWQTKTYRFINSEAYKVTRVGKPFTSTITIEGVSVIIESVPVTLVDSFGKEDTFNYVDVKNNQSNLQAATALAKEKSKLWNLARKATGETKRNYLTHINNIDSYLFINDNITEGNRTIQAKVIDFGYAMTVHKSQGSTFTHVLVDDTDISKATSAEDNGVYEIDLETGDTVKIGESGEKKVNVQQQLRYVAVSRATNTVSIISDNIKSEDSPLNHISEDEQFEESIEPVEQQPTSNSYTELFTPTQPVQPIKKEITEEENEVLLAYQQNAEFYSGGADGSDLAWDKYLKEKGLKVKHFTVRDYDALPQSEKDRIEKDYQNIVQYLGRRAYSASDYRGKLVRRDMLQAEAADAVFAIGEFDSKGWVSGGTAYAVTRAVGEKEVYFYDLKSHQWYMYETQASAFWPLNDIPTLTPHAAVIGTRDNKQVKGPDALRQEGHDAIKAVIEKTFNPIEIEETIEDEIEQQYEEKQKEIDKAVTEAEEFITANNSFSEQVENLINSTDVNQSEITELANEVSYYMSDLITQWQDNPKAFFENFPTKRKETEEESINWFNSLSRKQIVESIGIGNFLTIVKDRLFNDLNYDNLSDEEIDALDTKAMLFYENFDALLRFGMSAFRSVEDFNINYSEAGYKVEEVEKIDNNAEGNEFDNTNVEVVEDLGDKQEHWQIDSRTIDNFLSMSQIVKRELTRCYLTEKEEEGNTVNKTNSFGVNKRVDPKNATASILRWTQGAINLDQMISKLKDKEKQHPWLTQIISKLEDRSGKYTDFQGQFFSVFCKHFQEYYYILETKDRQGNRIMSTRSANLNPALREVMSGIEVTFRLHQHPLFDSKGVIVNKFNKLIQAYNKLFELNKQDFDSLNIEQISIGISYVAELLGYNVAPEDVAYSLNPDTFNSMLVAVNSIIDNIKKEINNPNYDPFAYSGENSIGGYLRTFLTPITEHLEDIAISAFYDSGKMYQSYVIPSYLTKLMKKFKESTDEDFKTFLKEEYGDYEWFRDTSDKRMKPSSWKNVWLRELASMTSEQRKKVFGHKVLLNYNGHNYMRNMTSPEYILATLTEFLSGTSSDKEGTSTAWYKIPMMSNKPSFEFIKFLRYKGADYQDTLTTHLTDVFTQELERIQTVLMRGYSTSDPEYIKNFDENGKRFMFLEYLNPYLEHLDGKLRGSELGKLINKKLKTKLSEEEDAKLISLLKEVIKNQMNAKANAIIEQYKSNGVFNLAKNIENIGKTDGDIENAIRNFVWNDTFASINILQLTITDTAYYANAEEVQKRLAQIHAPGMRGNIDATDYDGNPVSDGTFRTIFLKDFDKVKSNIIENLEIVFDRKIEQAPENEKEFWINTKNSIISQFEDINVADAQAYNSPTSYRKKAFMFGKWSRKSEEIYQKLKNKEYNLSDLETAFQPLKPFVYSQATKKSGVEGSPIQNMKVNMQFKNSEYLLIMADAILQGEKTGKPNLLRAIYEVMEESADKYPTQGIDTVQFESAVKAGLHARIDLNQCLDMENGEQVAKKLMEAAIYNEERGYYNTTYVHETPFEDYTIQQEVPAHFKDHEQAHGSQERMIIPSDLAKVDANGETVYYTFTDNGVSKNLTAEEFRKEYEKTIAESIKESIDRLYEELGLNIPNKKVRNVALSKILQKEILSSPRYGMDLYIACSVDKDGNFNIPLGDPIQSKRIEQLINSIIKNRVNKQKVAGGPVVQVTNYGTSTQLHIKFKDKNGDILPTLTEWLNKEENKGKTVDDYKKFLKEDQGGVAYYECYAPAYMQELLQDFMDEKGNLDIESIEATNPELLDMIGYRIPSEDLYSVAPLRIKGFLPKEAGEGIMLPYEITLITGSDFDIDKFYLMRKEFNIKRRKTKEIEGLLVEEFGEGKRKVIQTFLHLVKTDKFDTFKKYPKYAKAYRRLAFIAEKPTKGRAYRNNKVIDMSLAVLTHKTSTDRLLNPGGFEPQKRMGYLIQAYKMGKDTWKELETKSTSELKKICMTDKNLSYIDVNTQFYEQNNVAGTILGMFAVQKVAHSALEGDKLCVNVSDILGLPEGKDFGIAGKHFGGYMEFDATTNVKGEFIGKVLGSLVAAAADAVKDPVLNLMNINSTTANVLTTLIRLGVPFETASLLTSQDVITECLQEFNLRNLSGFVSFRDVLNEKLSKLTKETSKVERTNDINFENLSKTEMIKGLMPNASVEIKYKGLLTFTRALDIAMELKGPTFATRFNSISSAVGPLVANNIVTKHKVESFSKHIYKRIKDGTDISAAKYVNIEIEDIFNSHPILKYFHETLAIADTVFDDYIPANSNSFDKILRSLPENIRSKMVGDTKSLGQLIDFYLSYMLISSKCIDVDSNRDLKYYMNEFPKSFVTENIKEKYPNNPFIQAIKVSTSQAADGSTRYTLVINTTGMDNIDKERLSSGWADLYNENPQYALQLFEYNFYKGGIGFTPKTFMHLLPISIKRNIPKYIETFRRIPDVDASTVIDQFIRNNWQNGKFVPKFNENDVSLKNETVILNKENYETGLSTKYIRIRFKNKTEKLYKKDKVDVEGKIVTYKEISPLGNNGEYLEIATYNIEESLDATPQVITENPTHVPSYTNQEADINEVIPPKITEEEKKNYEEILLKVLGEKTLRGFRSKTKEQQDKLKDIYEEHFDALFAQKGVPYNPEEFEEIFKQFCGN